LADTTYTDNTTPITADTMNDLNRLHYTILGDPATLAALKTTLNCIQIGTPQAATSGTSIDFTSIPAGTKRITVNFTGISSSGTDVYLVQLGDSGGVENSGYLGAGVEIIGGTSLQASTGFPIGSTMAAAGTHSGAVILTLENSSSNKWTCIGLVARADAVQVKATGGWKALTGTLDRVRITTLNGTDTFDAGEFNITYE